VLARSARTDSFVGIYAIIFFLQILLVADAVVLSWLVSRKSWFLYPSLRAFLRSAQNASIISMASVFSSHPPRGQGRKCSTPPNR